MNNRPLFIVILLVLFQPVLAQKVSNFQVDLGLTQNHQGFFKLFDGTIDVGAGYNHQLIHDLYGGVVFRISLLNRGNTTARANLYRPQVNLHYYFHVSKDIAIIPTVAFGYSFINISNKEHDYKETQSGINPGGELRVLWKRERKLDFFLFGRFDFIYLDIDESFTRLEYYRKVYLTSFGIGMRIKSGKHE